MKPIRTFTVIPFLPPPLEPLRDLAYNLRWSWDHATIELFRRLDSDLWESSGHNPVRMLGAIDQTTLDAAATDEGYLSHLAGVLQYFDVYMGGKSAWFRRTHGATTGPRIAYFSAEFGITECLSIFAGGLGVLAGDHLKSASDLGIPMVGVGLLYQQGYFRQSLNEGGWQQETYVDNDFYNLPLVLERRPDGRPITISVAYPGRAIVAQIWRAQVGRVPLYLLDTNIPENTPADHDLTDQLYGGDVENRIKQEIMLGIGGCYALRALGLEPTVYHMNEGHSAFLALERVRRFMEEHKLSFAEAQEAAAAGQVFTTHTPVSAGHDYFAPYLMDRYFGEFYSRLGIPRRDLLALGRQNPYDENEPFCMTVLALRLASYRNGVSRLHGVVSRQMWSNLWPGAPADEIPITHVTNGVHFRSWISREMDQIYDRYLGARWREEPADEKAWQRAERIPDDELWRTHERRREWLVVYARNRLRAQLEQRGAPQSEIEIAGDVLDPAVLTIGFARRFAPYKRAVLLLRDPERLARILNNPERPMQLIYAGKAHPRDEGGKELIRQIVSLARRPEFRKRLVFIQEYDMSVARYLVQGADVWLNNPRRPQEASGTSGMKATANGALNLSTLDGWWDEAHDPRFGWAIGRAESYASDEVQDRAEAEALYDLLEHDVAPTFYNRSADKLPHRWIALMKASIGGLSPQFNTHRMVHEYTERFYLPTEERARRLAADEMAGARALAGYKSRLDAYWREIQIEVQDVDAIAQPVLGHSITARAHVRLAGLDPNDVSVELYAGRVDANGELVHGRATPMQPVAQPEPGTYLYETDMIPAAQSGLHGYTVRVLPKHPDLASPFLPGKIAWAKGS
ncbi:MAG: alpha-glucan family phosphorylase [Anaerolineae bacterium]